MTSVVTMTVAVPVTTLWVAPDSPRAVDAAMLRQRPDSAQWLAALDAHADEGPEGVGAGRLGLHGRVHSQLLQGEPVQVVGAKGYSWTEVVCPWQPCSTDPRGYRGWLPAGHLRAVKGAAEELVAHGPVPSPAAADAVAGTVHPALALARRHLGVGYLWGGMSPVALDCSGLVHLAWRELGVTVPRDAHDQQLAADPVRLDEVEPGDLYFFTEPGALTAHHVGIVVAPGVLIHAPETGRAVVEEPLTERLRATLSAAGRVRTGPAPSL